MIAWDDPFVTGVLTRSRELIGRKAADLLYCAGEIAYIGDRRVGCLFGARRLEPGVIPEGADAHGPHAEMPGGADVVVEAVPDHNGAVRRAARLFEGTGEVPRVGFGDTEVTIVDRGRKIGRQVMPRHPSVNGGLLIGDDAQAESWPERIEHLIDAFGRCAQLVVDGDSLLPVALPRGQRPVRVGDEVGEDVLHRRAVCALLSSPSFLVESFPRDLWYVSAEGFEGKRMIAREPGSLVEQDVADIEKEPFHGTVQ